MYKIELEYALKKLKALNVGNNELDSLAYGKIKGNTITINDGKFSLMYALPEKMDTVYFPVNKLTKIISKIKGNPEITLHNEGKNLIFTYDNSTVKLPLYISPEKLQEHLKDLQYTETWNSTLNLEKLYTASIYASNNPERYYMQCAVLDNIGYIATDGRRLIVIDDNFNVPKLKNWDGGLPISTETIKILKKLAKTGQADLSVILMNETQYLKINVDNSILIAPVLAGTYPNYKRVIPDDYNRTITFKSDELTEKIEIAKTIGKEIEFHISKESYIKADDGTININVKATNNFMFNIDPDFLLQAIKIADTVNTTITTYSDDTIVDRPLVIDTNNIKQIIMPKRTN